MVVRLTPSIMKNNTTHRNAADAATHSPLDTTSSAMSAITSMRLEALLDRQKLQERSHAGLLAFRLLHVLAHRSWPTQGSDSDPTPPAGGIKRLPTRPHSSYRQRTTPSTAPRKVSERLRLQSHS